MRIDRITEEQIEITLSKRNLLALVHKLDMEGSNRTLDWQDWDGLRLTVHCEPDGVHYMDREPGTMHPLSEEFIQNHEADEN
jgi:hypothetical protein